MEDELKEIGRPLVSLPKTGDVLLMLYAPVGAKRMLVINTVPSSAQYNQKSINMEFCARYSKNG